MLEELNIENLGVIESAQLSVANNLTVLTGETGAGKTMVLTSLGLLTGSKPDLGKVRAGSERAHVEGIFTLAENSKAANIITDAGGLIEDSTVVLARSVPAKGRSRAFAGGRSVPAAILSEAGEQLVAIHGQADQLRLRSASAQRERVDQVGGRPLQAVLRRYRQKYAAYKNAVATLEEWRKNSRARAVEIEILRSGIQQIDELALSEGEDDELRQQIERLTNVEDLREATARALNHISREGGIADSLGIVIESLNKAANYDAQLENSAAAASSIEAEVQDLAGTLASYLEDLQADPAALEHKHERLAKIIEVGRGRAESATALLRWREEAGQRLAEIDGGTDREEELAEQVTVLREETLELGRQLSKLRRQAAKQLGESTSKELTELAMPNARILAEIDSLDEPAEFGMDKVSLKLQSHPSLPPVGLGEGASGGELSRIMLALELSSLGDHDDAPVMIFDEIDAGIGGQAATSVGLRLARLAQSRQVIVVTHLAQVAAYGDRHIVVEKQGGKATVRQVEGEDRVLELARMLSGHTDSKSARVHAAELLGASHV